MKRALVGLAGVVLALVSATPAGASATGTLARASDLAPSRGGASGAPIGYVPLNARALAQAKARANAKGSGGGGKPRSGGGPTVTTYANVTPSFNANFMTGLTPPDTTGAIGPDRYIETVNTQYAIYTRAGGSINTGTLSALTGVSGGVFGYSLSDPQMMWDAATQRFYYSAVFYDALLSNTGLAVGWSKTATPASSSDFCKFTIGFGADLPDYPKLGDSADFLMYGYNLFGNGATTYEGSEFAVLNKPGPGSTCPATSGFKVTFSPTLVNADSSLASTPVPANLVDDSNQTGYVVANADLSAVPSANFISIWSVNKTGVDANGIPTPGITGPATVTVDPYSIPASAQQAGSSYTLDTLDGRFEAAVAATDPSRNKIAIWTAHAVAGGAGGGAGSEERWYEIDPNAATLFQNGKVSGAFYAWNGAVSPDRNGTSGSFGDSMAMSVSTSSATADPAIQLVWKKGANAQSPLKNLVQATGPAIDFSCTQGPSCRWGDYSGASPDPAATGSGKVWLGNQYNVAGGTTSGTSWRTWIAAVTPTP